MEAGLALGSTAAVFALVAAGIAARPEDEATAAAALKAAQEHLEAVRAKNNKPSDDDVPGWGHAVAPDGRTYWWDLATKKTQWNKPGTQPNPGDEPPPGPEAAAEAERKRLEAEAAAAAEAERKRLEAEAAAAAEAAAKAKAEAEAAEAAAKAKAEAEAAEAAAKAKAEAEAAAAKAKAEAEAAAAAAKAKAEAAAAAAAAAGRGAGTKLEALERVAAALQPGPDKDQANANVAKEKARLQRYNEEEAARAAYHLQHAAERPARVAAGTARALTPEQLAAIAEKHARSAAERQRRRAAGENVPTPSKDEEPFTPRAGGTRRRVLTFRRKPKSRSKNGRRPTRKSSVRRNR
jgi:hypothetical protein